MRGGRRAKRLLAAVAVVFGLAPVPPGLHARANESPELPVPHVQANDSSVPTTLQAQANDSTVERGHYLATAANCVSCHTREGGAPFAGGVAFVTPFGTLYSSNITSDPATGIGKWSREDFSRAVREGVSPGGEHLYAAFPYTSFTKLSDTDVAALYSYFRTVPAAKSEPPQNEMRFPYNQRWALGLWKKVYFDAGRFTPEQGKSAEWNRGAYLVQALGHCGACHSPRNFAGAESKDGAMAGGEYTDKVPSGALRLWSTPNITPAAAGLRSWSVDDLAAYLKNGRNSFAETFGPMNEVIVNSTRNLSDADVHAMATYLKGLPAHDAEAVGAPSADVLQAGENVYSVNCGTCHLPTGLGSTDESSGARLAGSPVVQASNPAALINVILYGPQLAEPPLAKGWKPMDGFGDKLADDEVAALTTYLRSSWGNRGGAVTAEQVAKQR